MAEKGTRSAKGVLVDFDLLKIKQQIASAPKPVVVQARETFIDNKFKRQLKKLTRDALDLTNDVVESADPQPKISVEEQPEEK